MKQHQRVAPFPIRELRLRRVGTPYRKPRLRRLGLLRQVTRFSVDSRTAVIHAPPGWRAD